MKLLLSAMSCATLFVLLSLFGTYKSKESKIFDSELWKAQHNIDKGENPRIHMVPELEKRILKQGMHREVVRRMLGSPERVQKNVDFYNLGVSSYGIDYEQYIIEYNQENKVIKFFISRG